jgi:hypothetical protein
MDDEYDQLMVDVASNRGRSYEQCLNEYNAAVGKLDECVTQYNLDQEEYANTSGRLAVANAQTESKAIAKAQTIVRFDALAEYRAAHACGREVDETNLRDVVNSDVACGVAEQQVVEHTSLVHRLESKLSVLEARVDGSGRAMELARGRVDAARERMLAAQNKNAGAVVSSPSVVKETKTEDMWNNRPSVLGQVTSNKIPVCQNVEYDGLDGM